MSARINGQRASQELGVNARLAGFLTLLTAVAIVLCVSVTLNRLGFLGYEDDTNYITAARGWLHDFPFVGQNHWQNRHPLVLAIAASFALFGESELSLTLPSTLLFAAVVVVTFVIFSRLFDLATAALAACLLASTPVLAASATVAYPLTTELCFTVTSLLIFLFVAERRLTPEWPWLILVGALIGTSFLTRQTAVATILFLGILFLAGYGPSRAKYWFMAIGFLIVLGIETLYFTVLTGESLHRYLVDAGALQIPSPHLRGGTYDGSFLFNTELMSRWISRNPVPVHWAVDPYIGLFSNDEYGFLFWAAFPSAVVLLRSKDTPQRVRRITWILVLFGVLWWSVVIYALSANHYPRYFGPTIFTAVALVALALRYWVAPRTRLLAGLIVAGLVATNWLLIDAKPVPLYVARAFHDVVSATNEAVYADRWVIRSAWFHLDGSGLRERVKTGPAPPGGLAFVVGESEGPAPTDGTIIDEIEPPTPPLLTVMALPVFAPLVPAQLQSYVRSPYPTIFLVRQPATTHLGPGS